MNLFDKPEAAHYVGSLGTPGSGTVQSLKSFHEQLTKTTLEEGSTDFNVHRAGLLTSSERWLAYSLAHYSRAFDMLVPLAAPWAQVTLYYASFFAANAILGMFGGWVGHLKNGTCLVEVEAGTIGSQVLRVKRKTRSPKAPPGSHQTFWDFFYDSTPNISPWAPTMMQDALKPVYGDYAWQTKERNNVNYDTYDAWASSVAFQQSFDPRRARRSLSGALAQQLDTTESMIRVAKWFAGEVQLAASGLEGCGTSGTREKIQRTLVKQKPPSVGAQSAIAELLA